MTRGKCPKMQTLRKLPPITCSAPTLSFELTCFISLVSSKPSLRQNYVFLSLELGNYFYLYTLAISLKLNI